MRRFCSFSFVGALIALAGGCNAILENEPGRLDRGASASGENGATAIDDGTGSGATVGDGTGAAPISGGEADAGTSPGRTDSGSGETPDAGILVCAVGAKACGDVCVSTEDPFYGCGAVSCARCELPNATAACAVGACAVGACVAGFADCNALPTDGCEASLATVNDCGACGAKCPALENVDMACVAGTCSGTCVAGFGDCNANPADGCEKNLMKDKHNCGACGVRCLFGRCQQGACVF
jgi:hypothetical protein